MIVKWHTCICAKWQSCVIPCMPYKWKIYLGLNHSCSTPIFKHPCHLGLQVIQFLVFLFCYYLLFFQIDIIFEALVVKASTSSLDHSIHSLVHIPWNYHTTNKIRSHLIFVALFHYSLSLIRLLIVWRSNMFHNIKFTSLWMVCRAPHFELKLDFSL